MASRARMWALLATSYVTLLETVHILWTGRPTGSIESLIKALVVPAAQVLVASSFARRRRSGVTGAESRRLIGFFRDWLLLAVTQAIVAPVVEYVTTRRIVLTDFAFFLLLAAPAAGAAALALPMRLSQRDRDEWRIVTTSFSTQLVVGCDVAILLAGWTLLAHPLLGMATAAPWQRGWIALKLVVAAGVWARFFLVTSLKHPSPSAPLASRRAANGASAAAAARVVRDSTVLRAGTVLLFLAALAVAMNAFLSLQPMHPWAGIATTAASLAATLFLVGTVAARVESP